jgi:hypothetical protein
LLSLGRTGWLAGKRLGSTTRAIVERTLRPLLILGKHDRLTQPLTVLYNGSASAERALALAARFAQPAHQTLTIWIVAPAGEAETWQARIFAMLHAQQIQPTFTLINNMDDLAGALQRIKDDSLVLPLDYADLLSAVEGPVLLVP